MKYYILFSGDTEQDTINDVNQIGDVSFNQLWPAAGYKIMMKMISDANVEYLNNCKIVNEKGQYYSPEEFMDLMIKNKTKVKQI